MKPRPGDRYDFTGVKVMINGRVATIVSRPMGDSCAVQFDPDCQESLHLGYWELKGLYEASSSASESCTKS